MKPCLLFLLLSMAQWAAPPSLSNAVAPSNVTFIQLMDQVVRYDLQATSRFGSCIERTAQEALAERRMHVFALTNSLWLDLSQLQLGTGRVECVIDQTPVNVRR